MTDSTTVAQADGVDLSDGRPHPRPTGAGPPPEAAPQGDGMGCGARQQRATGPPWPRPQSGEGHLSSPAGHRFPTLVTKDLPPHVFWSFFNVAVVVYRCLSVF
jgi:hypothetical protein